MTPEETTRIEFAERLGMLKRPEGQVVEYRRYEPPDHVFERVRFPDGSVRPCYRENVLPKLDDANHVHTALMGMSEAEWEKFADVLYCQYILNLEDMSSWSHGAEVIIKALKTPLSILVSCYLEATKGRTNP